MANPTTVYGEYIFQNDVTFVSPVILPDGTISNAKVATAAAIDADKLQHRHALNYSQADGADVVSKTQLLHLARRAGAIKSIDVRPTTAPAGGDKKFTVDVQHAVNGSATWTSLLNAVETIDSTSVNETKQAATLAGSVAIAADDALRVVITASGTTGTQGQGVVVTINQDEDGV